MNKNELHVCRRGVSLLTVVGIVLIVLKLCEIQPVTNWSWWLVTLPIWIQPVLGIAVMALVALVFIIVLILNGK